MPRIDRHRAYDEGRDNSAEWQICAAARPLPRSIRASSVASRGDRSAAAHSLAGRRYPDAIGCNPSRAALGQPQAAVAPGTMAAVLAASRSCRWHRMSSSRLPDRKKAHLPPKIRLQNSPRRSCGLRHDFLNDPPLHSVSKQESRSNKDWNLSSGHSPLADLSPAETCLISLHALLLCPEARIDGFRA